MKGQYRSQDKTNKNKKSKLYKQELFELNHNYILDKYLTEEYDLTINRFYCWKDQKWYDYLDIGWGWLYFQGEDVDLITSYKRYKFLSAIKKDINNQIGKIHILHPKDCILIVQLGLTGKSLHYYRIKYYKRHSFLVLGSVKKRPVYNRKLIDIFKLNNLLQTTNIPNLLSDYFTKDQIQFWLKELNYKL